MLKIGTGPPGPWKNRNGERRENEGFAERSRLVDVKVGLGQDSHRFDENAVGPRSENGENAVGPRPKDGEKAGGKPLKLAGVILEGPALSGNSDADVVLHAITNGISGITGKPVLGPTSDAMCRDGVTDSVEYLRVALRDLKNMGFRPTHVSCSIEAKIPKILPHLSAMRQRVSEILEIPLSGIGITATSGEGLTDFGRGLGVQVFAVVTAHSVDPL